MRARATSCALTTILMSDVKNLNYLFASFRKITKAYVDFLAVGLKGYDLTPNEIAVLSSLETVSTASDIAKDSEVSKALVSRSVASLKDKNYIRATISEVDKREQKLVLTDEGRRVAGVIDSLNEEFAHAAFTSFEDNEKRVLIALVKLLSANVAG